MKKETEGTIEQDEAIGAVAAAKKAATEAQTLQFLGKLREIKTTLAPYLLESHMVSVRIRADRAYLPLGVVNVPDF